MGTFTPTAAAKTLSRAVHFQGPPVPTTTRFSGDSGDPKQKPSNVAGMAVKFYLPDGTITDLVSLTLPAFLARTPEEFIEFLAAKAPNPATGQPDMAKLGAFLGGHPNIARVIQSLQSQPALASFAQASYRALHAFRFVNAADKGVWARYHWEPEAGIAGQKPEELAKRPLEYLFEEMEDRLRHGAVVFRLDLELAQEGDSLDDPSAFWPEGRQRVTIGKLELTQRITEAQIGDSVMMHDPTRVTDGIEVPLDDQILPARRGAYLFSVAERIGGWQQKAPDLFHATEVEAGHRA
jgi:catalase